MFHVKSSRPEPSLFDVQYQQQPPAHHDSATSQIAAASLPNVGTMRRAVLDYVRACGAQGAIRDEVCQALGMLTQTACGRLRELVNAGHLRVTTNRRPSVTGRPAQVYVAKECYAEHIVDLWKIRRKA